MTMKNSEQTMIQSIARQILVYLDNHPGAADTVEGISRWWLPREKESFDLDSVQASLDYLVQRGELEEVSRKGSQAVFRKSRGLGIRRGGKLVRETNRE